MRYYINTNTGPITRDCGQVIKFETYDDARHFVINHCDLSVLGVEIVDSHHGKKNQEIRNLIKAQDIIRQVYAHSEDCEVVQKLKQLDKDLSESINLIGRHGLS